MAADKRPGAEPGHCPSCGHAVGSVRKIGTWSGGWLDGDPATGAIYAADCALCDARLTGNASLETSVKDLEWRVER